MRKKKRCFFLLTRVTTNDTPKKNKKALILSVYTFKTLYSIGNLNSETTSVFVYM